jgi:hypothetical protein
MAYGPSTRTVGEVMRAVKRTFGDESSAQLEDEDIVAWINDAQEEINNKNKILKAQADITTTENVAKYSFPAKHIQQVEALLYDGMVIRNVSYAQALESYIGRLAPANGPPCIWYEWGGSFTLYPTPEGDKEITLIYTMRPTTVDGQSVTKLTIPDKYYQDVVRYVLQQAFLMDEAVDLATNQEKQFAASLEDKSEEERSAQQMTYTVITLIDD